jgi:tetratricopeptide (TPR) repeat protein
VSAGPPAPAGLSPGPTFGLIGGLAAFPRRLAARAAETAGGRLGRGTSRRTTHAIFGRTLLLRTADAEIAARAAAERAAGRRLVSENGFLRWLGLAEPGAAPSLSRAELIAQSRLAETDLDLLALFDAFEHDAEPFSFRDLILARKYSGLVAGGAGWGAIARSVHRAGSAVSLTAKSLQIGQGRAIRARHGDRLGELDGQLLLELGQAAEDADALFAAAEAEEAAGRPAAAALLYGRCLALDPGDAIAAFNRANCLAEAGRAAEAEQDYARALQRDPDFVEAWFNLACLVARQGRADAARRYLAAAVRIDPDYADAVYNLAANAFDAGDLAQARRWWTRYLELDPDSDWARTAARGLKLIAMHSTSTG